MDKQLEEKLHFRGVKPTAMRILVLKTLSVQNHAISLNDLESLFDNADRVTLYRTIKTFEEHKLIHRINDGSGCIKYALCNDSCDCTPNDSHLHFYCTQCELTYCLENCSIPTPPLPQKFRMQEINVIIKGLCDKCSAGYQQ